MERKQKKHEAARMVDLPRPSRKSGSESGQSPPQKVRVEITHKDQINNHARYDARGEKLSSAAAAAASADGEVGSSVLGCTAERRGWRRPPEATDRNSEKDERELRRLLLGDDASKLPPTGDCGCVGDRFCSDCCGLVVKSPDTNLPRRPITDPVRFSLAPAAGLLRPLSSPSPPTSVGSDRVRMSERPCRGGNSPGGGPALRLGRCTEASSADESSPRETEDVAVAVDEPPAEWPDAPCQLRSIAMPGLTGGALRRGPWEPRDPKRLMEPRLRRGDGAFAFLLALPVLLEKAPLVAPALLALCGGIGTCWCWWLVSGPASPLMEGSDSECGMRDFAWSPPPAKDRPIGGEAPEPPPERGAPSASERARNIPRCTLASSFAAAGPTSPCRPGPLLARRSSCAAPPAAPSGGDSGVLSSASDRRLLPRVGLLRWAGPAGGDGTFAPPPLPPLLELDAEAPLAVRGLLSSCCFVSVSAAATGGAPAAGRTRGGSGGGCSCCPACCCAVPGTGRRASAADMRSEEASGRCGGVGGAADSRPPAAAESLLLPRSGVTSPWLLVASDGKRRVVFGLARGGSVAESPLRRTASVTLVTTTWGAPGCDAGASPLPLRRMERILGTSRLLLAGSGGTRKEPVGPSFPIPRREAVSTAADGSAAASFAPSGPLASSFAAAALASCAIFIHSDRSSAFALGRRSPENVSAAAKKSCTAADTGFPAGVCSGNANGSGQRIASSISASETPGPPKRGVPYRSSKMTQPKDQMSTVKPEARERGGGGGERRAGQPWWVPRRRARSAQGAGRALESVEQRRSQAVEDLFCPFSPYAAEASARRP